MLGRDGWSGKCLQPGRCRWKSESGIYLHLRVCKEQTVKQVVRSALQTQQSGNDCYAGKQSGDRHDLAGKTGRLEFVAQVESLDKVHTDKSAIITTFVES